jgi:hypothetical protein
VTRTTTPSFRVDETLSGAGDGVLGCTLNCSCIGATLRREWMVDIEPCVEKANVGLAVQAEHKSE